MKIAISATGKTIDNLLDMRFGRCEYFQVYDTESKEIKFIESRGKDSSGVTGVAAANQLISEKVTFIITDSLGPNVFEIIEKTEIKAYKCGNIAISTVLKNMQMVN